MFSWGSGSVRPTRKVLDAQAAHHQNELPYPLKRPQRLHQLHWHHAGSWILKIPDYPSYKGRRAHEERCRWIWQSGLELPSRYRPPMHVEIYLGVGGLDSKGFGSWIRWSSKRFCKSVRAWFFNWWIGHHTLYEDVRWISRTLQASSSAFTWSITLHSTKECWDILWIEHQVWCCWRKIHARSMVPDLCWRELSQQTKWSGRST